MSCVASFCCHLPEFYKRHRRKQRNVTDSWHEKSYWGEMEEPRIIIKIARLKADAMKSVHHTLSSFLPHQEVVLNIRKSLSTHLSLPAAWAAQRETRRSVASPHWWDCWRCWCIHRRAAGWWWACTSAVGPSESVWDETCWVTITWPGRK